MKTLVRLAALVVTVCATIVTNAQTPDAINYQAVARAAGGDIMANQTINVTFIVHSGSAAGPVVFEEDHNSTSTNQFGLFSLQLGQGSAVTGTLAGIDFSADSHWLEVEVDGNSVGTQQLVAVPYSMLARNVENDNVDDADADPANELQTLSQSGSDITLSNGGGTVSIDDNDSDPTNELQTISKSGSTVTLSDGGGSFTDDNTTYSAGTGINISGGNVISNTGDTNAGDDVNTGDAAGGDLSGTYPNPLVDGLQNRPVSAGAPGVGEVLKWNGAMWAPGTDNAGGGGLTLPYSNSVNSASDAFDITNTGTGSGLRGVNGSTSSSVYGVEGVITSTSPGGSSTGVRGINNGTGGNGIGVWGSQNGSGWGVYGTNPNGIAVYGRATGTGRGGHFESVSGNALTTGAGNVGIGTSAPTSQLDVNGAVRIRGGAPAANTVLTSTDGLGNAVWTNPNTLITDHNTLDEAYDEGGAGAGRTINANAGAVHITGTGGLHVDDDIGIGTTSPTTALHIDRPGAASYIQITHPTSGSTASDGLWVGHDFNEDNVFFWNWENSDMSIGSSGTGDIVMSLGIGERMRITNPGHVGINHPTPAGDLVVLDAVGGGGTWANMFFQSATTGTTATDGFMVGQNLDVGDATIWNWENQPIMIATDGTERMRVDANGTVGIGTTTPAAAIPLNVHSSTGGVYSGIHMTNTGTGQAQLDGFFIGQNLATTAGDVLLFNGETTDMVFVTDATERMRIEADGGVAINTATANNQVQINGTTSEGQTEGNVEIWGDAGSPSNALKVVSNSDGTPGAATTYTRTLIGGYAETPGIGAGVNYNYAVWGHKYNTGGTPEHGTVLATYGANPMIPTTAAYLAEPDYAASFVGSVGIATTAPAADLHIKQSASPWPDPTTGGIILEHTATTTQWQIWASNPFCSFAYGGSRVAYVNNTTGAWTVTSDRRFKKNVEPVVDVLDKIGKLNVVKYHYNQQPDDDSKTWGLIAQNVEEVLPELVQYSEDKTQLGLAYSQFSVVALKAVQELTAEIDQLKARIAELESQ